MRQCPVEWLHVIEDRSRGPDPSPSPDRADAHLIRPSPSADRGAPGGAPETRPPGHRGGGGTDLRSRGDDHVHPPVRQWTDPPPRRNVLRARRVGGRPDAPDLRLMAAPTRADCWGFCPSCDRWFYVGSVPDESPAACPVCWAAPSRVVDRNAAPAAHDG
jgi:hypothetical protein